MNQTPKQRAAELYKEADLQGIADLITDLDAVKKLCLEYDGRLTKVEKERDAALERLLKYETDHATICYTCGQPEVKQTKP